MTKSDEALSSGLIWFPYNWLHSPGIPVKDLVAKGYRWVTVNGPYACVTEEDVSQIMSDHSDLRELHMVENLRAYYLIRGTLGRVIQDNHANGMSEILSAGITRFLSTYTKFLSARPIHDTYGTVETPDNAGLVDPSDAAIFGGNRWELWVSRELNPGQVIGWAFTSSAKSEKLLPST